MKQFTCFVASPEGRRQTIYREAPHKEAVLRDLNQEGYVILSVEVSSERSNSTSRIKSEIVLEFTQILATLTANGLKLNEALTVAQKLGRSKVSGLLAFCAQRVSKGESLYHTLSNFRSGFPPIYLGLIRIGEKTGDRGGNLCSFSDLSFITQDLT